MAPCQGGDCVRIRPHDSAESCGLCHPSPRNTYFQPKPGSVANCECGSSAAAPGSHRPLVGGNGRSEGGGREVAQPGGRARTDQRSVPTGVAFGKRRRGTLSGRGGLPPPGTWRTEALLCAVCWMPGRARHYVQSDAGQSPALRAKRCRAEPGTTCKAMPGRARRYVQSDAGQSPALRAKRLPGSARRDQATPAPLACTSAWYDERTIGPEATWLKPSS